MTRPSPFVIMLSDADRAELQRRARCYTAPHAEVLRAKIVLLAAEGTENTVIAARLDVHVGVVSRWRGRFAEEGIDGLADRKRSGRPRVFAATVVAPVKAMACEPPEDRDVPQSRWSAADLAARAVQEGWRSPCRGRRCGAGWRRMRSGRGGTGRGSFPATRTSRSRAAGCWICTSGSGRAASWPRTST